MEIIFHLQDYSSFFSGVAQVCADHFFFAELRCFYLIIYIGASTIEMEYMPR